MNLKGATALVTGGSNGIGLAIAKTLTEAGAKVAITGRDEKRLAAAGKAIGAQPVHADVAKEPDVLRTYKELFQRFDHLDILVNNAGFGVSKPLVEMDLASFEQVFATNVTGAMLVAREAAKHFVERKSGNIINIGSTAAVRGAAKGTPYYGSKFPLRGMTECSGVEQASELFRFYFRLTLKLLKPWPANRGLGRSGPQAPGRDRTESGKTKGPNAVSEAGWPFGGRPKPLHARSERPPMPE